MSNKTLNDLLTNISIPLMKKINTHELNLNEFKEYIKTLNLNYEPREIFNTINHFYTCLSSYTVFNYVKLLTDLDCEVPDELKNKTIYEQKNQLKKIKNITIPENKIIKAINLLLEQYTNFLITNLVIKSTKESANESKDILKIIIQDLTNYKALGEI